MTVGEKIYRLRTFKGLSQEELADRLEVSRQSVSKWEMDEALPQLGKVLLLCDVFGISTDELLRPEIPVFAVREDSGVPKPAAPGRYFGADGFVGEVGRSLCSMDAYRVGRFLGWYYAAELSGCRRVGYRPRIAVGKDPRRSGYMLEYSLAAGITASGADAYLLHVTPTAGVSFVTRQEGLDCGVMLTASHAPYIYNGIKIFDRQGNPLSDEGIRYLEKYLDGDLTHLGLEGEELPSGTGGRVGAVVDGVGGRNRYVGYLISLASHSYRSLKIGLDCANGAAWMIAKAVFDALGAQTYVMGVGPDGYNINDGVGTEYPGALCAFVTERGLDCGFAFDGDADRCIAVDEGGHVVDGSRILSILAKRLLSRGMLDRNTVVITEACDASCVRAMERAGIRTVAVADDERQIRSAMGAAEYSLGGTPDGRIFIKKYATDADGILTAILLAEEMVGEKLPLSKLARLSIS